MTDIEIASKVKLDNIKDVALKLSLTEDEIECYGSL